jgi:hypothetical protein
VTEGLVEERRFVDKSSRHIRSTNGLPRVARGKQADAGSQRRLQSAVLVVCLRRSHPPQVARALARQGPARDGYFHAG